MALITITRNCTTHDDCAIRDIGNCCGYYPGCVSIAFCPDIERVKTLCKEQGMASVCGWSTIDACACREGQCTDVQCDGETCSSSGAEDEKPYYKGDLDYEMQANPPKCMEPGIMENLPIRMPISSSKRSYDLKGAGTESLVLFVVAVLSLFR
eukprot:CAMPEP_0194304368 /NCGR_PEP_ID=MMETSP0171-20130528/2139_1 /TAXON_ID=218684 /ORGANISM="Corethron pennatum, Strain L29A3" /LENGTH=152 /DNA_ID=CAMNT_0039055629 /DNA_START=87 /DNA_END=545 /DNA_ORIENTATION=+